MDSILEKNLYLFKEHVGFLKAHNNYDIYDPESKEMILHCREKNLNILYKIIRIFRRDFKRMTPFEIEIKGLSGKKILKDVSIKWKFDIEEMKSLTSDESSVVRISNLKKI